MTKNILTYMSTAFKKYIESSRQELRLSIALARNPTFENKVQSDEINKNIKIC